MQACVLQNDLPRLGTWMGYFHPLYKRHSYLPCHPNYQDMNERNRENLILISAENLRAGEQEWERNKRSGPGNGQGEHTALSTPV